VDLRERLKVGGRAQLVRAAHPRMAGRQRAQGGRSVRAPAGKGDGCAHHVRDAACLRLPTAATAAATTWSTPTSTAAVAGPSGTKESTARTEARRFAILCSARSAMIA